MSDSARFCPRCKAVTTAPTSGRECLSCQRRDGVQTARTEEPGPLPRAQAVDARQELAEFDAQTSQSAQRLLELSRRGQFPPWWVGLILCFVAVVILACAIPPIVSAPVLLLGWLGARAVYDEAKLRSYRRWRQGRLRYRAKLAASLPSVPARTLTPQEELAILERDWSEEARGYVRTTRDGRGVPPRRWPGYTVALVTVLLSWGLLVPALWSPRAQEYPELVGAFVSLLAFVTCVGLIVIFWTERGVWRYHAPLANYQRRRKAILATLPPEDATALPVEAVLHRLSQLEEEWQAEEAHFVRNGQLPKSSQGHFALVLGIGAAIVWFACTAQLFIPILEGKTNDDKYATFAFSAMTPGVVALLAGVLRWLYWVRRERAYARARTRYLDRREELRASVAYLPGFGPARATDERE